MAHHDHHHVTAQAHHPAHSHHGHGHHHGPVDHNRAFAVAVALNIVFVGIEFSYGFAADSTALMADAGHNLSDVLGLLLAWSAGWLAKRQPSARFTYGLRSSSILAALTNAMLLLAACGAIAWEAAHRFSAATVADGMTVAVVAAIGIAVNGLSAWLFVAGSKNDLNIRGAFLHMMADALVSLGVVVTGLVILYTNLAWIDPLVSLVIVGIIVAGTWGMLRQSMELALSAVPTHIDPAEVRAWLGALPGVTAVCDLHIWGMSTTENALTAHLLMPGGAPGDAFLRQTAAQLQQRFSIHHSTLQVMQQQDDIGCSLTP